MKPDYELARDAGWTVEPMSLYDEEGIEGWQWIEPNGTEHTEIGDWSDPPTLPESAKEAISKLRNQSQPDESAKHTPGPWAVVNGGMIRSADNKRSVASCHCRAEWANDPMTPTRFECEANARLIAASPELLEACERLFYVIKEAGFISDLAESEVDQAMHLAESAIAKATIEG